MVMKPSLILSIYGISVLVFFLVDMIWLGLIASNFYRSQLGSLLTSSFNWPVAIAFYLLFLIGLSVFVIVPAIDHRSIMYAVLYGALFGFFTYATYDLTNWATLRDWPALLSIVDMCWGAMLSATVSAMTTFIALKFLL